MIEQLYASDILPYTFAFLLGFSLLVYSILDGYDLGVGILTSRAKPDEKDKMIGSIGPFWDANETWLVLGAGLLLVAFPAAHGTILTALYLPVALMLFGLIFRGVSFDFRAKSPPTQKRFWDRSFFAGSLIAALAQGYMLGVYITGFDPGWQAMVFSLLFSALVVASYSLIGACWLIMKCEDLLQKKAIHWAKFSLLIAGSFGLVTTLWAPIGNERLVQRLSQFPDIVLFIALPLIAVGIATVVFQVLKILPMEKDRLCWLPFVGTVAIFLLAFLGLIFSFYPYIIPGQMKISEAASAPESLLIILIGTLFVLPVLIGYTIFAYRVFHGKVQDLRYD